jgi:hypothetical protein
MLRILLLVALWAVPLAAQRAPVLVGVDDGGSVRPLARLQGRTWSPSCEAPARGAVRGTAQRPVILVGGNASVEDVHYVQRGGIVWRQLEPMVKRIFGLQEKLQDVPLDVLAGLPIDVESIATSVEPATRPIYYFTASKTVPNISPTADLDGDGQVDGRGDLRIDVVGWVRAGMTGAADKNLSLGTNTTLTVEPLDDRRPSRATAAARRPQLTPLGIVRIGDAGIWVMQGRAGQSRWFSMYDVGIGGVRMVTRSDPQQC